MVLDKKPLQDSGVIVVDKPAGISSAGVVGILKKMLKVKKAGHTGTLDPFATGVLVCCINRATRLADFFLSSNKTYRATMVLGTATDTQDATGNVISRCEPLNISTGAIDEAIRRFNGAILQRPPVFSALKHKGVPLYKLARNGNPVQKPARRVHIEEIHILAVDVPEVRFEVQCSAGTYIRTLCADIGSELGCGGHLSELRRTDSSGFPIEEAMTLEELKSLGRTGVLRQRMIGMAEALKSMPGCIADDHLIKKCADGKTIGTSDFPDAPPDIPSGFFKIVDGQNRLVAVMNRKKDLRTYEYRCVFRN